MSVLQIVNINIIRKDNSNSLKKKIDTSSNLDPPPPNSIRY